MMPDWMDAVKLTWLGVGMWAGWAIAFAWMALLRIIRDRRYRAATVRHFRSIDRRAEELRRQGRS